MIRRLLNWMLGRKSIGVELIAAERFRQLEDEGWTDDGDDRYRNGELVFAAVSYCIPAIANAYWPFSWKWFKTSSRVRNLEKAGALIAAEIDRLKRLELHPNRMSVMESATNEQEPSVSAPPRPDTAAHQPVVTYVAKSYRGDAE